MALKHPYTAYFVAQLFLDVVVRLHGLPDAITSDGDVVLLSIFWQDLFTLEVFHLHTSSAYHPQSDGQTDIFNRSLETYLRCFCSTDASDWSTCIVMTEYW